MEFLRNLRDYLGGRSFTELLGKGVKLIQREGLEGLSRIYADLVSMNSEYQAWIHRYDMLTDHDRSLIRQHIERFRDRPKISVLMPVYNPPACFLRRAIGSVRRQLYPHWELCIADDASSLPHVRDILEESMYQDPRIRVVFRRENGHISRATNTALDMATGEFIALLDHDDEFAEHALYLVAAALNDAPQLDLLYSDEDKINARGRRFGHYFKPDWNPDLFLAQNLISHLGVYRRSIALEIGGFRVGFEGSQDWDFALRFVSAIPSSHIRHLPYILYHWRAISGSTAVSISAKRYAVLAASRALEEYWQKEGRPVTLTAVEAGHFVTHVPLSDPPPKVSIIICTRNRLESLRACVDGLLQRTCYPDIEILVVANDSSEAETLQYLATLQDSRLAKVLSLPGPFNFSALNNIAVTQATGDVICLLHSNVIPASPDWLKEMVAHALRPKIGAVGAKLLYPDNKVHHGGVFLNGVAAGHLHQGLPGTSPGYGNRAQLPQNLSAVTAACMVVRKQIWQEVGGMDEGFAVDFNDVDFCLRVQARGYRNLWLPQALLIYYGSASWDQKDTPEKRERFAREINRLQECWGHLLANDPYWNPNLALNGRVISLAAPPRVSKPWHSMNIQLQHSQPYPASRSSPP